MSSLKQLRTRIRSVKSTQKITSAMKMVAAARLRRSQERVEAVRDYYSAMHEMVSHLLMKSRSDLAKEPLLLTGHENLPVHLLVVVTTDRGLCGGFNGAIVREAKSVIRKLQSEGKEVKIFCLGRKGQALLRSDFGHLIIETVVHGHKTGEGKSTESFSDALEFSTKLQTMLQDKIFGQASILFTVFHSALTQTVAHDYIIPFPATWKEGPVIFDSGSLKNALYEYEPNIDSLLEYLLPRYIAVELYHVFLENNASEQGARMTAMDNATRNAQEMIQKLARTYHQTRQAYITKELIEIISAAEAM
ncbi:MAG: ATP synthase F1 subunit gamma [Alphaproteobacteria bacterium]|jgi:F-type H+-transporting ATPase subunit gamma|nr:ATP synthase F1 subunit gamma [Alphaproteobacteria bacterium]